MAITKKRTKSRASIFSVPYVGYPFDVLVAVGATDVELADALDSRKVEYQESDVEFLRLPYHARGQTVMLGCGWTVLRLKEWSGSATHHSDLAHEIFHAVEFMFRRIGIRLCSGSHEAYAYAIDSMTREILKRLASKRSAK